MASIGPREIGGKIFVNYRRGDDQALAGRLFDRLGEAFGREQLFMDVDSIAPGLAATAPFGGVAKKIAPGETGRRKTRLMCCEVYADAHGDECVHKLPPQ